MFTGPFDLSIVKRAIDQQLVDITIHNLRDYSEMKNKIVDDYPFGGGGGMVMKPEPLFASIEQIKASMLQTSDTTQSTEPQVVLLTPQGQRLTQNIAEEMSLLSDIILICGHYDGIDERVTESLVDREISIGDYVLTGGEIPAMVLVDAIIRLIPGVVGDKDSLDDDTHTSGLIQFPQYTRPQIFRGMSVPDILLSGNHEKIRAWRERQSIERTLKRRPDMLNT